MGKITVHEPCTTMPQADKNFSVLDAFLSQWLPMSSTWNMRFHVEPTTSKLQLQAKRKTVATWTTLEQWSLP